MIGGLRLIKEYCDDTLCSGRSVSLNWKSGQTMGKPVKSWGYTSYDNYNVQACSPLCYLEVCGNYPGRYNSLFSPKGAAWKVRAVERYV